VGEVAQVRIVSPFRARTIVLARRFRGVATQVLHNRAAVLGLGILIFFFVLAVAAPWIAPTGLSNRSRTPRPSLTRVLSIRSV